MIPLPKAPILTEVNPRDAGRFINHSSSPNLGFEGALRDISEGEEVVMDYNQHGDPASWRCHPLDPRGQQLFIGEGTPKERALGGHDLICVFFKS